jgi:HD superfamily phosphohydrolase
MSTKTKQTKQTKQIYDPIHGFVDLTPLMQSIIDTPEFQRLRYLKQLGAVQYVYPSATHTRFEHSIGVSHLANIMARHLFGDTSIMDTNHTIAELTQVAGLIHDLGHGPFSHLYDSQVRQK